MSNDDTFYDWDEYASLHDDEDMLTSFYGIMMKNIVDSDTSYTPDGGTSLMLNHQLLLFNVVVYMLWLWNNRFV